MSGSPVGGFLEFFILEAGDYVEQLDRVLLGGASNASAPDTATMQRVARALRGTATMAKIPAFADLAGGVEQVGRAMQEGALQWNPALGGALVAAIDDLKILLRATRSWSPADEQRAAARAAELAQYAPSRPAPGAESPATEPAAPASSFLATEASNIAAGLELLTTRVGDADTAANVLRRVRALRGVAGVKEIGPLADVLEATEDSARGLESGEEEMSAEARQLLEASAAYLRTLSASMRGDGGGDINAPSSARDAFTASLDAWAGRANERERVVPIGDLFFADGAPGLVEASPNPPTSAAARFNLELVSHAEHLRQVIDAARNAADKDATVRARRDLRRALRALQSAAQSFEQADVAEFVGEHADAVDHLDFLGLAALEGLASVLAQPGVENAVLHERRRDIAATRGLADAIGAGFGDEPPAGTDATALTAPVAAPTPTHHVSPLAVPTPAFSAASMPAVVPAPAPSPAPAPAVVAPTAPVITPRVPEISALDNASAALIDSGIAALDVLASSPLATPVAMPEYDTVPVETLLYTGRAALERALQLRDEIRQSGDYAADSPLQELFDLLELARAE